MMPVSDSDDVYLLLCEKDKSIYPVCDATFKVSQSSLTRLRQNYVGCIILKKNGELLEIQEVHKKGLYGINIVRKILSAFTGAYSIKVESKSLGKIPLENLKKALHDYLVLDRESSDPLFSHNLSLERIGEAESIDEVFDCLNLPRPEDCLDVL